MEYSCWQAEPVILLAVSVADYFLKRNGSGAGCYAFQGLSVLFLGILALFLYNVIKQITTALKINVLTV